MVGRGRPRFLCDQLVFMSGVRAGDRHTVSPRGAVLLNRARCIYSFGGGLFCG